MKNKILELRGSNELEKSELKRINGGVYVRYCCEYFQDANGNPTDRCIVWSIKVGAGTACP